MPARLRFRANFGTRFHIVTLSHLATAQDSNNLTIRVFAVECNDNAPQEVYQHKALVFRQRPMGTLVAQWKFEVNRDTFHGTATTLKGDHVGNCFYVLFNQVRT